MAFADLQISCSRLPSSPNDPDSTFWLGCESFHRYPCATSSTGYGPGANVVNVLNPLKMPSERIAPDNRFDNRFIGSFRYLDPCLHM